MLNTTDIHIQFAELIADRSIRPFAYLLSRKLAEGSTCLFRKDIESQNNLLPDLYAGLTTDWNTLASSPLVSHSEGVKEPFFLEGDRLYLQRFYMYEKLIFDRLCRFSELSAQHREQRQELLMEHKDLVNAMYATPMPDGQQTDWQMVATITAVLNNFTIITGGPGTGKTTTVARVLQLLYSINSELKVALAAPTGKAAARMLESLKHSARFIDDTTIVDRFLSLSPYTVHRLLGYIPDSTQFRHNKENPLTHDVIIVDESSMLDVALMAKLFAATGDHTRLILLGDKDQLASVEAGSILGDLCEIPDKLNRFAPERLEFLNNVIADPQKRVATDRIVPYSNSLVHEQIIELTYSRRFKDNEGIGLFSKAVIRNNVNEIMSFSGRTDEFVEIDDTYSSELFKQFVRSYENYIAEPDIKKALSKFNRLRVLAALRQGEQGVIQINKNIESYLVHRRLISVNSVFYENRPIMVTSNNYSLGLFNGDIGLLRRDEKGTIKAWFEMSDGSLMPVIPAYISSVETAYAMTIHKSQGSEFDDVCVILPQTNDIAILTSELLYTAVTRAKQKVLIQGKKDQILAIAGRKVNRASGIAQRYNKSSR